MTPIEQRKIEIALIALESYLKQFIQSCQYSGSAPPNDEYSLKVSRTNLIKVISELDE